MTHSSPMRMGQWAEANYTLNRVLIYFNRYGMQNDKNGHKVKNYQIKGINAGVGPKGAGIGGLLVKVLAGKINF